jgi:hypothetical protein
MMPDPVLNHNYEATLEMSDNSKVNLSRDQSKDRRHSDIIWAIALNLGFFLSF